MDLSGQRRSDNVDDRRGGGGGRRAGVGLTLGGVVVALVVGKLLGLSPVEVLQAMQDAQQQQRTAPGPRTTGGPVSDQASDFVRAVLGSTEDAWDSVFQAQGKTYPRPTLVLFRDTVDSACGFETAATGPFYCPGDQQVYLDVGFFDLLSQRFGAPGDFAQAYVIAHEVGHHVQKVLGTSDRVHAQRTALGKAERNALSVRLELQADCFAGVWANRGQKLRTFIQEGDVEEAIKAATAIGDDTLQRGAGRAVSPESFTHGSSAQRVKWFKTGMREGTIAACDTFAAEP
ncbi:MAG: neutral zinc metallopeptidase [Myxococcaceae bacterium]|nr:neutral zinc metallopeptidase [Myxococcaceae bacterium]